MERLYYRTMVWEVFYVACGGPYVGTAVGGMITMVIYKTGIADGEVACIIGMMSMVLSIAAVMLFGGWFGRHVDTDIEMRERAELAAQAAHAAV